MSFKRDREGRSGAQYHCDYCRKDISNVVRIRCAECSDFDLCLECFSVGVEVQPHRNTHKYRVIENVTTPIFDEEWGADEELLLLEAIEMYGLGNWADVSEHVGKSRARCESHYYDVYLKSKTAPLPDTDAPLLPRGSRSDEPEATRWRSRGSTQAKMKKTSLSNLVGYIPQRGDFDTEYDQDAELVIADMDFKPEDTVLERELKLKVLEIYSSKLDARAERKKFILERGLLDPSTFKRSRTREERQIEDNLKCFARFHSKEDHERLVEGLIREQQLRKKIARLQEYRAMGIRTFADAEQYELQKRRNNPDYEIPVLLPRKRMATSAEPEIIPPHERVLKKRKEEPLDLSKMEGVELLSEAEVQVAAELHLLPHQYLQIKDAILRESFQRGLLDQSAAQQLITVDINKTSKVMDFFITAGWVNSEPKPHDPLAAAAASGAEAASPTDTTAGPSSSSSSSSSAMQID